MFIIYEHLRTVQQKILLQVEFLDCFVLFVFFTIYSTFVCRNAFHDPLELMYVTLAFQKKCDIAWGSDCHGTQNSCWSNPLFTTFVPLTEAITTALLKKDLFLVEVNWLGDMFLLWLEPFVVHIHFSTNLLQCTSKAWVIYIGPKSGIASGILHILIVKTAVTLVTSTPQ